MFNVIISRHGKKPLKALLHVLRAQFNSHTWRIVSREGTQQIVTDELPDQYMIGYAAALLHAYRRKRLSRA